MSDDQPSAKQGRSAAVKTKKVAFTYAAPDAESVVVTGAFCDWQTDACRLRKDGSGVWKKTLSLNPGQYEYRFVVDGEWHDDPACPERIFNAFGTQNCVLIV